MKIYKSIEEVIAEIDVALAENQNAHFGAKAFTQDTINALDDTPEEHLPDHFSIRELIHHRKWTRNEIDDLLGTPDEKVIVQNGYIAHLYAKERVLNAEKNPHWFTVINRGSQIPLPEHRLNPETIFCSWHGKTEYRRLGYSKLCIKCYPLNEYTHYRVRDLYDRGWFAKEIIVFLGEPHAYCKNAKGWKTKLYLKGTVHLVEATEGWQNRTSVVAQRLYLDGITIKKIAEILTITQGECYNYTKHIREMVRDGTIKRGGKYNAR